ncbi:MULTISPECIES: type II secretion system F family protein [unclassified Nocardioides]|uniref:type II secretion system F family protein n=1 Tax=unclassified Nocardioides TaxID=2615069 RepID=UPI0030144B01
MSGDWLLYAGLAAIGLGLAGTLVLLVPRRRTAMAPDERVTAYAGLDPRERPVAAPHEQEAALAQAAGAAGRVLHRNRGLEERIAARLDAAGSGLQPAEWLLVHTGVLVGAGLVGLLVGRGSLVLGLVFLVLGALGPWLVLGLRRSRRRRAFEALLPETLQLMSGSLAAGLSLAQSVDTIVREGSEPVAGEFRRVLVETRLGVSLEDALEGVADRFRSRDLAWTVMAVRIQREVGGNLAELLDTVAATMREREYVRRQVNALAAEGKLSAIVLAALPPVFLLYLLVANRDYVEVLFTDVRGLVMLVGAGLWLAVGALWMSRLVRVEV